METYHSIAPAVQQLQTANRPLQMLCDDPDLRLWVVKAAHNRFPAYKLAKELIGYRFAEIWSIKQPMAALIKVDPAHIKHLEIDPSPYSIPCFGSRFRPNRLDWDKFIRFSDRWFIRDFTGFEDLLRIALFDLWIGNEDRFHQNHNLLLESDEKKTNVLAIDHEAILNATDSNHNVIFTDSEMMLPDEYYNLLSSPSVQHVLQGFAEKQEYCSQLTREFPRWIELCKSRMSNIFAEMPLEWEMPKVEIIEYLQRELFKPSWIEMVSEQFTILARRLK